MQVGKQCYLFLPRIKPNLKKNCLTVDRNNDDLVEPLHTRNWKKLEKFYSLPHLFVFQVPYFALCSPCPYTLSKKCVHVQVQVRLPATLGLHKEGYSRYGFSTWPAEEQINAWHWNSGSVWARATKLLKERLSSVLLIVRYIQNTNIYTSTQLSKSSTNTWLWLWNPVCTHSQWHFAHHTVNTCKDCIFCCCW